MIPGIDNRERYDGSFLCFKLQFCMLGCRSYQILDLFQLFRVIPKLIPFVVFPNRKIQKRFV